MKAKQACVLRARGANESPVEEELVDLLHFAPLMKGYFLEDAENNIRTVLGTCGDDL